MWWVSQRRILYFQNNEMKIIHSSKWASNPQLPCVYLNDILIYIDIPKIPDIRRCIKYQKFSLFYSSFFKLIFLFICCFCQGVVYQLDVALQSVETQRAGLVFVYDMTDSKYTNFDYELSQKILTMLKVSACVYICFFILTADTTKISMVLFDIVLDVISISIYIYFVSNLEWKKHSNKYSLLIW